MLSIYPIRFAHMTHFNHKVISFSLNGKDITISDYAEIIYSITQKSDGTSSIIDIATDVSNGIDGLYSSQFIEQIIQDLLSLNIIIDSREVMQHLHFLTENPNLFFRRTTSALVDALRENRINYIQKGLKRIKPTCSKTPLQIERILQKRCSCRDFADTPLDMDKIFSICRCGYSDFVNPVASAGNLKPLSLYFINMRDEGEFPKGIYQYDHINDAVVLLRQEVTDAEICYALNDPDFVFNAPCIFFAVADIDRHCKKYANRGYRFTLLEAGHTIQNMTIAGIELGVSSVEYGGFNDSAIETLLGISKPQVAVSCLAMGYQAEDGKVRKTAYGALNDRASFLEQEMLSHNILEGKSLISHTFLQQSCLYVVISQYAKAVPNAKNDNDRYGTGIGHTFVEANIKSLMESYERHISGKLYIEKECPAKALDKKYLSPLVFAPYTNQQIEYLHLLKFDEDKTWQWITGRNEQGEVVYIPIDLCFYPIDVNRIHRPLCHYANSSGCAAHFDETEAKKSAVAELIERDALMKVWLKKEKPLRINISSCPRYLRERIETYETIGCKISILLLNADRAYSVMVCSQRNEVPFFVSGAAASFESVEEAISKAFNEMEYSLIASIEGRLSEHAKVNERSVITPVDHGNLYKLTNQAHRLSYLFEGTIVDLNAISGTRIEYIHDLNLIYVRYPSIIDNVTVVRAFSDKLLPINFGFNSDFIGHTAIGKSTKSEYDGFPHFFS